MCSKNGGYTGGLITTPSPCAVTIRSSQSTPAITSGSSRTRSAATAHPCRAAANDANASPSPAAFAYPRSCRSAAARTAAATGGARS